MREFVSGYYTRHCVFMLLGAVFFVLLIACSNIANLQFPHANGRAKEIAIRVAMGARRLRLMAQLMSETLPLPILGALAGLAFGA